MFYSFFFITFILFIVFFFKQKTAYEMRISDWSSDVCSSDLHGLVLGFERNNVLAPACMEMRRTLQGQVVGLGGAGCPDDFTREIGRASCRERVCQYV